MHRSPRSRSAFGLLLDQDLAGAAMRPTDLALRLGVTRQLVVQWRYGDTIVTVPMLGRLGEILGWTDERFRLAAQLAGHGATHRKGA